MAKFRNKSTGAILEPNSQFVEEQMKKNSALYEEVAEKKPSSKEKKD